MDPLKKKFYLYLFLVTTAFSLIVMFDYRFIFPELITKSQIIIDLRKKIQNFEKQNYVFDAFQKEKEKIIAGRKKIEKVFPKISSPLDFLYFLENTARKTNNDIKVKIKEADPPVFSLEVTGSFNSIIKFLAVLETMPLKITFNAIGKQIAISSLPPILIGNLEVIYPFAKNTPSP